MDIFNETIKCFEKRIQFRTECVFCVLLKKYVVLISFPVILSKEI